MAKKRIRHLDFSTLAMINGQVVALTNERHEYTDEDERRLKSLVREVELKGNNKEFEEAMIEKTSLLMFRIATGQHFHEGNKRTGLVAGSAFLEMNGYAIDMRDKDLVSVIDKAGIAAAALNDVHTVIKRLISNVKKGT